MVEWSQDSQDDYPLAHTDATRMLAAGLERVHADMGLTQKEVASRLSYKTSVVLSHMALGRVPIPIDRAEDIAGVLGLDRSRFLMAVLNQRHPSIDFNALFEPTNVQAGHIVAELEALAGTSLDLLPQQTIEVLREVVACANPARRWITPEQLSALDALRG